jgi:hypothetical protein
VDTEAAYDDAEFSYTCAWDASAEAVAEAYDLWQEAKLELIDYLKEQNNG